MKKEPVFLGIYSRQNATGAKGAESHWHVWGLNGGSFLVQKKVADGQTAPEPETIDSAKFFEEFRVYAAFSSKNRPKGPDWSAAQKTEQSSPEPEPESAGPETESVEPEPDDSDMFSPMQAQMVLDEDEYPYGPAGAGKAPEPDGMDEVEAGQPDLIDKLAAGARPRGGEGTYFAGKNAPEPEAEANDPVADALLKVEQQLRSEFSIALIRLQSNRSQALESLEKILANQAPFRQEHKHMFSDFGTSLRRRKLFAMSARFHERAKALGPDDEHILFNLARALHDGGKTEQAALYLREAVAMARDFQAGSDFLAFIEGRNEKA